jgi:hypothetical protein
MAVRGIDGAPSRVKAVGQRRYQAEPGYYGEFMTLDELELTMRAQYADPARPINVDDMVMERQDQLLSRRLDRQEKVCWDLVILGVFSSVRNNIVMHSDRYTTQTYASVVAWSTVATATPIADFRAIQLLSRGRGADFGAAAEAWMNRTTFNNLLSNTNAADLGGRRGEFGASLTSADGVNRVLAAEGLPQIVIYDEGYYANDDGTGFTLWIPDGKVVIRGARPAGQTIGEFRMTRNVNNPNFAPGVYQEVIDRGAPGPGKVIPRTIEVHDGFNGGPVLFYPGSIVVMSV